MDPSSFNLNFHHHHRHHQQPPIESPSPPLQGPRPPRLKVNKTSHKINKPPTGLARAALPPPQPVIIYTVSPKVIRTKPSDFMAIVQRLTGVNSSPTAIEAAAPSAIAFPSPGGAPSPAARFAAVERAQMLPDPPATDLSAIDPVATAALGLGSSFGGILSPNPISLPSLSPGLFSTSPPVHVAAPEINSLDLLHDMMPLFSPVVGGGGGFGDVSFQLSPLGFTVTPTAPSPIWDLYMNSPQPFHLFPPDL